jgi:tetratricopeptide (TPR) repeat protein
MSDPQGVWRLDPQLERRLEWANKAAERGDWDKAIDHMRKAIEALEGHEPVASAVTPALRSNLAVCLANRGGKRGQDAMFALRMGQPNDEAIRKQIDAFFSSRDLPSWTLLGISYVLAVGFLFLLSVLDRDDNLQPLWERLLPVFGYAIFLGGGLAYVIHKVRRWFRSVTSTSFPPRPACAVCGRPGDYRMELPGRGEVALCGTHSSELHKSVEQLQSNPLARGLLESAERDLAEALELDPSLEAVQANLHEIRSTLAQLPK